MIEVIVKCDTCQQDFVQVASTEEEVKTLQRNIWHKSTCCECEQKQHN